MDGMVLTEKKLCAGIKNCPYRNRTRSERISNQGIRREKPATNRLRNLLFENIIYRIFFSLITFSTQLYHFPQFRSP